MQGKLFVWSPRSETLLVWLELALSDAQVAIYRAQDGCRLSVCKGGVLASILFLCSQAKVFLLYSQMLLENTLLLPNYEVSSVKCELEQYPDTELHEGRLTIVS